MPSVLRDDLFAGRTVVVTGGGTGIGRAVAHELASLGATVAIGGRRGEPLATVRDEITAAGGSCLAHELNIRDEASVAAFVDHVLDARPRIDGLVNNAGGQFVAQAEDISTKGFTAVVETNLLGTFQVTREVFRRSFAEHGGGAVVSITMDNLGGAPGMSHSGAARAGVENLTRSLAVEWASRGVRLNVVAPGIIRTSGLDTYPELARAVIEAAAEHVPYKRLGSEAEVASAVAWLLSPGAAYVSGATLRVDGGAALWRSHWHVPEHDAAPGPFADWA